MVPVPDPVTVWKVELVRGREPLDVRGILSLGDDALEFTDDEGAVTLIAFSEVARAKRLRGSPVLLIARTGANAGETAFYFAQPPSLRPPDPASLSLREATRRRPSKRRQQRDNTGYLTGFGTMLKPTIDAWAAEVRDRVARERGSG